MLLSIVAPVFNEQECISEFHAKTSEISKQIIDCEFEWIYVNDGSSDKSLEILTDLSSSDPRIKIVDLSRNFGHQVAVKCGIDHTLGDAIIMMDADLQDPPQAIIGMVEKWREGYDVVYAVRESRVGESFFKKITATLYYRLLKKISNVDMPLDAGDFRLISQKVVNVLKNMDEKAPYLRGLISWVGFKQIGYPIKREARYAGKTKYPLIKMLRFAWSGITHFSFLPLHIASFVGVITSVLCLLFFIVILYAALILKITVPGWASLMVAVLFLGSVQLITLGIIGSYLAKNYDESRKRPLYLVQNIITAEQAINH